MVVSIFHADMEELIEGFEAYLAGEVGHELSTVRRYVAEASQFTATLAQDSGGEAVELHLVAKARLRKFLSQGTKTGEPSPSLWNLRLFALRAFYQFLLEAKLVEADLTAELRQQELTSHEPVPLSLDEYLALVEAAERSSSLYRSRNVAIVEVFYHCALRVSELCSLQLAQLDFERYQFSDVRRKGGKKYVSMPFNDLAAAAIQRYLADRPQFGPAVGEDALFLSDRGTGLAVRSAQEIIRQCARGAGINRPVGPHIVRHSGPTELASHGTPLPDVQDLLDHKDIATTRRYTHAKTGARRRAVDVLGTVVSKRREELRKREEVDSP